jgi:uncharacterized protein Yka (UPF0111/DUF47 family)
LKPIIPFELTLTTVPMTIIRIPKSHIKPVAEVDLNTMSSANSQLKRRMDRIADNYRQLDSMLHEIEAKIQSDERLKAIDETIQEVELQIDGRKRRWRPRRTLSKKSSAPRKPR